MIETKEFRAKVNELVKEAEENGVHISVCGILEDDSGYFTSSNADGHSLAYMTAAQVYEYCKAVAARPELNADGTTVLGLSITMIKLFSEHLATFMAESNDGKKESEEIKMDELLDNPMGEA